MNTIRMERLKIPGRQEIMMCKAPSLVDLCVQIAIDNVRYLGNVGETDFHLLERILPHCTPEQLVHVENCTEGRDLSPVTDKLWKKFYELHFGAKSSNLVMERMIQNNVTFTWRQLYEAKLKDVEDTQQKSLDRIRQLYKKEEARKQVRRVQICTKVPPSSSKRSYHGGTYSGISNTKSTIMKKAKLEFLNSQEVKNLASMKNKAVQRKHSVSYAKKPGNFSNMASSLVSKMEKPIHRRLEKTL